RTTLAELDREYTLSEIVIITAAGPARALGLSQKGHLGAGADADVVIYPETAGGVALFKSPRYVLKGGEIVGGEGQIRREVEGRGPWDGGRGEYLRPLSKQLSPGSFDTPRVGGARVHGMGPAECRSRR